MMKTTLFRSAACGLAALGLASSASASTAADPATSSLIQEASKAAAAEESEDTRKLRVEPAELTIEVGATAVIDAQVIGSDGAVEKAELMFFSRARRSVTVGRSDGVVTGLKPGTFEIIIRERRQAAGENQEGRAATNARLSATVSVTVKPLPLASIEMVKPEGGLYAGTVVAFHARGLDAEGGVREDLAPKWTSSHPGVASFDASGELTRHTAGTFTAMVDAEGRGVFEEMTVAPNPIVRIEVEPTNAAPRTGDVIRLELSAYNAAGEPVPDVPVDMAFRAQTDDTLGPAASGQIEPIPGASRGWRFVAAQPGRYTFVATSGNTVGRAAVTATARDVKGKFTLVGHAPVRDTHTSDLWVWEGTDGRDYAVTGTWGANGDAHFWDVTDPANMERIATVNIDARTVNDVKVSADGRTCILSREGASNRKNGIVIVDVTDPRNPKVRSGFDENLTGGVHNVFIDDNKVYALSAGARYDSIDISDPGAPTRVGSYKVDAPSPSIHDVWVEDGLAYSSNWSDGVHIVDVGNGMANGSPSNPVKVASYAYPNGWNHAAFPFRQESGRFYVAAGDEAFPLGLNLKDKPTYPRGWIHFIDFTDFENPSETARYQVPEAGTHNMWVDGDVMYVAYYNAGLRAVDVSGELMGNIYDQGREIAWFLTDDPEGYISNAPMVWGPQPHKGHIFFSDWNSGLWAVKLER